MSRRVLVRTRLRSMPFEAFLYGTIVLVVVAACLQSIGALSVKARLAAVFITLPTQRMDVDEAYANAGEFPAPAGDDAVYMHKEKLVSFELLPRGAGLLAQGTVGRDAQPFEIAFVPAVSEDGEASLRWMCGLRRAPAGWRAASAPATLVLPHGASYSICRDVGAEGA